MIINNLKTNSTMPKTNSFANMVGPQMRELEASKVKFSGKTKPRNDESKLKTVVALSSLAGISTAIGSISKGKFDIFRPKTWKRLTKIKYSPNAIIGMAAGSVGGGLVGGAVMDEKKNLKPKVQEAVSQMVGNVLAPIASLGVAQAFIKKANLKDKMPQLQKVSKHSVKINKGLRSAPNVVLSVLAMAFGVIGGNLVANNINRAIFNGKNESGNERKVRVSDLSAHADDVFMTASLLAPENKFCQLLGKLTPLAVVIPGIATGSANEEKRRHGN